MLQSINSDKVVRLLKKRQLKCITSCTPKDVVAVNFLIQSYLKNQGSGEKKQRRDLFSMQDAEIQCKTQCWNLHGLFGVTASQNLSEL